MGRYYSGDIEGKFWFGLQPSDCADRFGSEGEAPNYLHYYFDQEELPEVEAEIKRIEDSIDEDKIRKVLESNDCMWNDELLKNNGIDQIQLRAYADLELGKKIRECIKEHGECQFSAEL